MSVKLNYSPKYFIQDNPPVKNNPDSLVPQEIPAKDCLLPFELPKLSCRNTKLNGYQASFLFSGPLVIPLLFSCKCASRFLFN